MEDVREKLGILNEKAKAAHTRIDKLEFEIRDDLKELMKEVKDINAHVNRSKGWASAMIFISGFIGAGLFKLLTVVFK